MTEPRSFTGRRRIRKTKPTVKLIDRAARVIITVGGLGTIATVLTVSLFLLWVALPLLRGGRAQEAAAAPAAWAEAKPARVGLDESGKLGWALLDNGEAEAFRLDTGKPLDRKKVGDGAALTAWSFAIQGGDAAFGFADGSIRKGRIGIASRVDAQASSEEPLRSLKEGESAEHAGGLATALPGAQVRLQSLEVKLGEPIKSESESPVALLDYMVQAEKEVFCAFHADGSLRLSKVRMKKNMLTGETTLAASESAVPLEIGDLGRPDYLRLAGRGENIYVAWKDGTLMRFDARDADAVELAETVDLVEEPGAELTALEFIIGASTLVAGDTLGRARAWFGIKQEDANTSDGIKLVAAHELAGPGSPVRALAASARARTLAVGYESGAVRLFNVTTESMLLETGGAKGAPPAPILALAISTKEDSMFALRGAEGRLWSLDVPHPEASASAFFRPVWYEGYERPEHVWQSSSGSDDFEPKLGLMPLIFGTLKATVYSMLFGAPLALLAAIYTSEFLHPRARARLKPTIELMASLPSVVLGFLAALVFAPFVERAISACLLCFVALPCSFALGGLLWQLLPRGLGLRMARWRFAFTLGALPLGLGAAWLLAPLVERALFAGDIKLWLDRQSGSPVGGWMILFIPACSIATLLVFARFISPPLRALSASWTRLRQALLDLAKAAAGSAMALGAAWILSSALAGVGLDARGSFISTYVQRNALIVGFVMGFAIIPIIYTIAEDALSTVPGHLRSASLAAGATPWQTATRIVVPTAMSGLFSAVMIGLGRAVGETMIVLMAAGNTPVMEWNVFNGFRTLSANIAVELPEAVRDSTHYRTLFLAALTLFAMTFVLNTVAEAVRLRFRKRAYQL